MFCLISEFQISDWISEILSRGSWHPAEGLSLDLQTSPQILGRGSWNQISGSRTSAEDLQTSLETQGQILDNTTTIRTSLPSAESFEVRPDIWNSDTGGDVVICYCILIILIFFYVVNLRTRFDEPLDRISDPKNLSRGFED